MVDVKLTDAAAEVLSSIRARRSGPLTMVIGNGCCDSTAPFVFENHFAGPNEALIGELDGGVQVLLDRPLLSLFEGREVVVDAADVACADSFSCEAELGKRFSCQRLPVLSQSS